MSDVVTALDTTWTALRATLAGLEDPDLARPTPCTEWTVRDLAAHLGAVESGFQGLPQPPVEAPGPEAGIDGWTAAGIAARRQWTLDEVLAEIEAASRAQLAHLRSLDADGWQGERMGPVGPTTEDGLARIRLFDLYVHLLDLRSALDRPLAPEGEPEAAALAAARAVELTPWAAVKKAQLGDGTRLRLDLSGPGGGTWDVVVQDGRGRFDDVAGEAGETEPDGTISGSAVAYLLVAAGRPQLADAAGGIKAEGDAAQTLLDRFRMFQ